MALSRIERWTRDVLEHEARKRGIRDPELRSHAELVRLILRHDYASPHSIRNARKLIGSLLETAGVTLRSYAPPVPTTPLNERRPAPVTYPDAEHSSRPVTYPDAEHSSRLATYPDAEHSSRPATYPDAEHSIAPAAPKLTAAASPGAPEPAASPKPPTPASSSVRLDHSRSGPRELHVRWQISEQAAARARSLLGSDGELAVRLVSVRADPTHVVLSDVTEHGPIDHAGEWVAELASADTHCVTAVGVRDAGRFVSIVHRSSRPERIEAE